MNILLILSAVFSVTAAFKKTEFDSDSDVIEPKAKKINVEKLMDNFKVNLVDETKPIAQNNVNGTVINGTVINGFNGNSQNVNGTLLIGPDGKATGFQYAEDDDKKFKKLVKQVFGAGKNDKKKHLTKDGRELKYYKDTSVPMMMRKVIPPRGAPIPMLHFEYQEGNSTCRCSCKL